MNAEWILISIVGIFTGACSLVFFGVMGYLAYKVPLLIKAAASDLDKSYKLILAELNGLSRSVSNIDNTMHADKSCPESPDGNKPMTQYDILVREFGKQGYDINTARNMASEIVESDLVKEIGFQGITE